MRSPQFARPYFVGLIGCITLSLAGCGPSADTLASKHLALLQAGKIDAAQQQYCLPETELLLYDVSNYEVLNLTHENRQNLRYMEVTVSLESKQTRLVNTDEQLQRIPVDHAVLEIWESDDFYDLAALLTAPRSQPAQTTATSSDAETDLIDLTIQNRADVNTANQCIFIPPGQFD